MLRSGRKQLPPLSGHIRRRPPAMLSPWRGYGLAVVAGWLLKLVFVERTPTVRAVGELQRWL